MFRPRDVPEKRLWGLTRAGTRIAQGEGQGEAMQE
jgi:hypothetical protein